MENDTILQALLTIKEDIGSIKSSASSITESITSHEKRISALEASHNAAKGKAKVWTLIGAAIGSTFGFLITIFFGGKH